MSARRPWWPWADEPATPPAPEPPAADLTEVLAEHNARWRARALAADEILVDAFRRHGRWVPVDVVLDAHNALRPPRRLPLRPAVPVIPGPPQDG